MALALVAQAFVGKKPHLIKDADNLFKKLQQAQVTALDDAMLDYSSKGNPEVDFALERGLCSLLVGELDDCRSWLGLDSDNSPYRSPSLVDFVLENSNEDYDKDLPGLCKLLEAWLMEVVFPRFRDTKGLRFKLGDYYDDPKVLRYLEGLEGVGGSPLAAAAAIVRIGAEASAVLDHVKASAIQALQKVFPLDRGNQSTGHEEDGDMNYFISDVESEVPFGESDRGDSARKAEISGSNSSGEIRDGELITEQIKDASVKIMSAGVVIGLMTLVGLRYLPARNGLSIQRKEVGSAMASNVINLGMKLGHVYKVAQPSKVSSLTAYD